MSKIRRYILQLKLTFITLRIALFYKYYQMRYNQTSRKVAIDIEIVKHAKRRADKRLEKMERIGTILHGEGWLKRNHTQLTIVPSQEE